MRTWSYRRNKGMFCYLAGGFSTLHVFFFGFFLWHVDVNFIHRALMRLFE